MVTELFKYRQCYVCADHNCENAFEQGPYYKKVCPRDVLSCYVVYDQSGITYRGCYAKNNNTQDIGVELCDQKKLNCYKCNHNNCNDIRVVDRYSGMRNMCFTTKPRGNLVHDFRMRMEPCFGKSLDSVGGFCYLLRRSKEMITQMGCTSDLTETTSDDKLFTGDLNVVNSLPHYCFKCHSDRDKFCRQTDHLKPYECGNLRSSAARGCYQFRDRLSGVIERGCMSEMGEFMLKFCIMMNQKIDACYVCPGFNCNYKPM